MGSSVRDRNLLFGIFAVQLRKITPQQLIDAAAAWAANPSLHLPARLHRAGALSEADKLLLEQLVNDAVAAHAGDAAATLASFGGDSQVYETFRGSILRTTEGGIKSMSADTSCVSDDPVAAVPSVREMPGRYTVIGEHGRGGMGRVYRVHDTHLNRDIALKELWLGHYDGSAPATPPTQLAAQFANRFLREARITGQLEHPAIVPVYELGRRDNGRLYYTMKFVRGKTLSRAIREAGSLNERLALLPHFIDACQALAYAHSRGIIHRDIKPNNIMIGDYGETVMLDWGLAKAKETSEGYDPDVQHTLPGMNLGDGDETALTRYGEAMGTPAYMPPEQARGDVDAVDEKSDIYSLGAVLYELITSVPPHHGASVDDVVQSVLHESPTPIRDIEPTADPDLVAICHKAMAKDPGARFQTAKELAQAVQRWRPRLPGTRYLKLAALLGVLTLLAIIIGTMVWVRLTRSHYQQLILQELDAIEADGGMLSYDHLWSWRPEQIVQPQGILSVSIPGFLVSVGKTYPNLGTNIGDPWYDVGTLLDKVLTSPATVPTHAIQTVVDAHAPLLELALNVARRPPATPDEIRTVTEMRKHGAYGLLSPYGCLPLGDLLLLKAVAQLQAGADALDPIEDVMLLSQHLRDVPGWIWHAQSSRLSERALDVLALALRSETIDPARLDSTSTILQTLAPRDALRVMVDARRLTEVENYRKSARVDPFFSIQSVRALGIPSFVWWRRYAYAEIRTHRLYLDALQLPYVQAVQSIQAAEQFRLENYPSWITPGSILPLLESQARLETRVALAQLAVALYRARNTNAYPAALDDLAPAFIANLPEDLHGNDSFAYRAVGDQYYLYALGPNHADNSGALDDVCWTCPP